MNITLLNGNPDVQNKVFDRYLDQYKVKMHNTGHYIRTFNLREMKIADFRMSDNPVESFDNYEFADDFRYIFNSIDDTDLLIIASPLDHGFLTLLTKMILDRLTRVLQPPQFNSLSWMNGRTGHGRLPIVGMILQKEADTSEQDLLINKLSGERIAANIHSVLDFCITTDTGVCEAVCRTFQSIDYKSYIEKTYTDLIAGSTYTG